jgi:tRNA pseudouridine55 synthase
MRRIGHTGTLDPRATGLLILCLGGATRLSEHLTSLDKVYEGDMRFGIVTDSYDLDGKVIEEHDVPPLTLEQIEAECGRLTGDLKQVPPMVSAVKVGGERLYKRARHGETVEREPRSIKVHEFSVLGYDLPDARIRVRCSSGTYVRSLCHDVGQALGCGAALASLRRMAVGPHTVENAAPLDSLMDRASVAARLVPLDNALSLPEIRIRPVARRKVLAGNTLMSPDYEGKCPVKEGWIQIKMPSGELLALGVVQTGPVEVLIQPKRVVAE